MKRKHKRLMLVGLGLGGLGVAASLVLTALEDNIMLFHSPSELATAPIAADRRFRLGGLVADGSVVRGQGTVVGFVVTDGAADVKVTFDGILPDLFREGQGIVANGRLGPDGTFVAEEVLAKHDETYMPAEVKEALEKAGQWKGAPPAAGVKATPYGSDG